MHRTVVRSSNVQSVGYHLETQTLEVEFRNGGVYHYHGVPFDRYKAFMTAPSKGSFLARVIKSGNYPYSRVWEVD